MLKKCRDFWVGLVFLILGCVGLVMAIQFADPVINVAQAINSRFLPIVVCSIMIVFAALLVLTSLMELKAAKQATAEEEQADKPEYKRVAATLIALIVFVALMDKVGFLVMSILYLPVQMFILAPKEKQNRKNILLYAGIGIVAAVAIYFLFVNAFHVMLPKGIL